MLNVRAATGITDESNRKTGSHPERIKRVATRLIWAVTAVLVIYFFSRFGFQTIPSPNDALEPFAPGGSRVILDRFFGELEAGHRVIYTARWGPEGDGAFCGRVVAGPGVELKLVGSSLLIGAGATLRIELSDEELTVWEKEKLDRVPEGHYIILNENPESAYPDARTFGPIPVEAVKSRIIMRGPF